MQQFIEIAYAVHDHYGNYYEYLGISLVSVMENTKESLRFHILCDETLSGKAREELRLICEGYGQQIVFHDIALDERIVIEELLTSGYCEGILYRLYLPELLPDIPRIIYLDVDIIANGDISKLWEFDISGGAIAGRWDPPLLGYKPLDAEAAGKAAPFRESTDWNRYINSGVLVMDLDRIRKGHRLIEEAIDFWRCYGMMLPDQDVLNFCLREERRFIPIEYNLPNRSTTPLQKGLFYHYTYQQEMAYKLDPVDNLVISCWEKTPFYRQGCDKKEKIMYLRRIKSRREVYERLQKIRPLRDDEVLGYARSLFLYGDFMRLKDYLSEEMNKISCGAEAENSRIMQLNMASYLARAHMELGEKKKAAEVLEASVSYDPESSYIAQNAREMIQRYELGDAYYENGQYPEAHKMYLSCLYFGTEEKTDISVRALSHLIKCEIKMEQTDSAKEHLCMLMSIRPFAEETRLWKLQIEIAERKIKKREAQDSEGVYLGSL